eukprot:TRINITY_DN18882_c2_g1_i3.p1 TRINITY_DN18882_c2_g1~~TRINITY_DN18882_c2_g1_i3.p1  ORF type:complete len:777 (-),score=132.10 TRINITY_DN18882_c2_g1_i3:102-2348(-)
MAGCSKDDCEVQVCARLRARSGQAPCKPLLLHELPKVQAKEVAGSEVENVLRYRKTANGREYFLIHWANRPEEEATWEPLEHLSESCTEWIAKARAVFAFRSLVEKISTQSSADEGQIYDLCDTGEPQRLARGVPSDLEAESHGRKRGVERIPMQKIGKFVAPRKAERAAPKRPRAFDGEIEDCRPGVRIKKRRVQEDRDHQVPRDVGVRVVREEKRRRMEVGGRADNEEKRRRMDVAGRADNKDDLADQPLSDSEYEVWHVNSNDVPPAYRDAAPVTPPLEEDFRRSKRVRRDRLDEENFRFSKRPRKDRVDDGESWARFRLKERADVEEDRGHRTPGARLRPAPAARQAPQAFTDNNANKSPPRLVPAIKASTAGAAIKVSTAGANNQPEISLRGFRCMCGKTEKVNEIQRDRIAVCHMCRNASHLGCVLTSLDTDELKPDYVCPPCRLERVDEFHPAMGEGLVVVAYSTPSADPIRLAFTANTPLWKYEGYSVHFRSVNCGVTNLTGPAWPHTAEGFLNGRQCMSVAAPKHLRQRREQCYNLGPLLTNGSNELELKYTHKPDTPSDEPIPKFCIGIVLTKPRSVVNTLRKIHTLSFETESSSKERLRRIIAKASDDNDVSANKSFGRTLNPLCPVSLCLIEDAAIGKSCNHIQVFDLNSYVKVNQRMRSLHKRWTCPVCSLPLRPDDVVLDPFTQGILDEIRERDDVQAVVFDQDCSWSIITKRKEVVEAAVEKEDVSLLDSEPE